MYKCFLQCARYGLMQGLLILGGMAANAQSWTTVGVDGFTASGSGVANWQKLMIDQYNVPYLSYNDEGFGLTAGTATVMKFDGSNWVPVGNAGFTAGLAHHSDLTFGNGDTLYFSYANGTGANMSKAAVMMFDGNTWSSIGTDISVGACQYTNLLYSSTGELYLGMIDMGSLGGAITVKKYNGGTSWVDVGVNPIGGGSSASYASMSFDNLDTLYVAYRDDGIAPGMVKVRKFDGTDWQDVGAPILATTGPGAGAAMDIYIDFDLLNRPYVSYSHTFQGPPRITVERFDSTTWAPVGPVQFSSGQFETSLFSSLCLPKDAPYVAFQNGGLGLKASVKKYNATTMDWDYLGTPGISDGVAAHTSMAMDGNGNLYLAYYDEVHGGKNTVKKYTVCEEPVMSDIIALDTPVCNGMATLKVQGILNDATQWQWYSGSCNNGTYVGAGDSIVVDPAASTTYFVKGTGGCVVSGPCLSVTVNVGMELPVISLNNDLFTSSASAGNQWYLNGAPIAGATSSTHTASQTGWYYTKVTDGDCSRMSDSLFYESMSVNKLGDRLGVSVYPVPFRNMVNIELEQYFGKGKKWDMILMDPIGRTLIQSELSSRSNAIDVTGIAAGSYFIKVSDGTNTAVLKVVKQ